MIKFFKNKNSGFTLIEIMIVVCIVAFFAAFLVINFRTNEKSRELKNSALMVLDGLKKVQTRSLSGGLVGNVAPVAYDLVIADLFLGQDCKTGCIYGRTSDTDFIFLEKINLEDAKIILPTTVNSARVDFEAPRADPKIYFNGTTNEETELKLEIKHLKSEIDPLCVLVKSVSGRMEITSCK